MPLLDFWSASPKAVEALSIEQVVASAGDGVLRDASTCSQELRTYLKHVEVAKLGAYVEQCLGTSFSKSGLVLQDLVNELGRRLRYEVTDGSYQGAQGRIGFDGLWKSPEGHFLVVEVKTTDAYRISLDTLALYRSKLIESHQISGQSSILIVVGRQDTGELEAQVRGSRHAWDIRLISVDSLLKLVRLEEHAEGFETGRKIRSVLAPMEYTRLDGIIDVVFTTATDLEVGADLERQAITSAFSPSLSQEDRGAEKNAFQVTDAAALDAKRQQVIAQVGSAAGVTLIKRSRALYWDQSHEVRAACAVSKRYEKVTYPYWYAYHSRYTEFLSEVEKAFMVFGCMDLSYGFAVPHKVFCTIVEFLNTTTTQAGDLYWHVHLIEPSAGALAIVLPKKSMSLFALDGFRTRLIQTSPSSSQGGTP